MPTNLLPDNYKGWAVYDNGPSYHPVTGRWVAVRFGVRMGANTEALLRRMIDNRVAEYPKSSGA